MAKIQASTNEKSVTLRAFLGLNENPDGDNKLKLGEATVCRNWKVTNSGNLMKRYGTSLKYTLGDSPVKGMWHGWCTKHELSITACDGHLFILQDNDWLTNPTDLGSINTDNDVFMFGFDEKVYMLNGYQYCEIKSADNPIASSATISCTGGISDPTISPLTAFDNFATATGTGLYDFDYRAVKLDAGTAIVSGDITSVTVVQATWESVITDNGIYIFTYDDGDWTTPDGTVTLSDYGISYTGTAGDGDQIIVDYSIESWYYIDAIQDLSALNISYTGTAADGDTITVDYHAAYTETVWSMTDISDGAHGYRPLVANGVVAGGGGTLLEEVNKLNGMRRVWITGDGTSVTYKLPEVFATVDKVINNSTQAVIASTDYSHTSGTDTITFDSPPPNNPNIYEIQYSVSTNFASAVAAMRYAEMYAGTQDNRIFIYGDGSNRTFYSGLDYNGHPRADYFPDLYEVTVGDANTPITGLIRHYTKLLAFKPLETFSIDYGIITLADGLMTPAFYTTPVNKNAGNQALGQIQLVLNAPRSLCQGNLYEWRNGSSYSANISIDERQAKRISDRIYATLRQMDFSKVHCYDDNLNTEYYIVDDDGNALVHNYFVDAWYYYTGIDARMMMAVDGVLYIGTKSGKILVLDETKQSDNGRAIDCYWESGSMDFGAANMRKYSSTMWVSVKSEDKNAVNVTVKTDRSIENNEVTVDPEYEFDIPKVTKLKVKVKKFVYYKLVFKSNDSKSKATIVDTVINVRVTSKAK